MFMYNFFFQCRAAHFHSVLQMLQLNSDTQMGISNQYRLIQSNAVFLLVSDLATLPHVSLRLDIRELLDDRSPLPDVHQLHLCLPEGHAVRVAGGKDDKHEVVVDAGTGDEHLDKIIIIFQFL